MNEEKFIGQCISEIKAQAPDSELIIVDAYSKDNTRKIARSLGAKVLLQKPKGAGAARNKGAEVAQGDLLCFVDADAVIGKGWVKRVREIFSDPRVVAASGPLKPLEGNLKDVVVYLLSTDLLASITALFKFYQFQGPQMIFRKDTFRKMGGFQQELLALEDNELGNRAKRYGKVVWDRKLIAFTSTRRFEKNGYFKMTLIFLKAFFRIYLLKENRTSYSERGG